jgi:hypothetical protein
MLDDTLEAWRAGASWTTTTHGPVRSGFAARYFATQAAPASACGCWRSTFDVAADQRLLIAQQLLLGITAHVNFGLPSPWWNSHRLARPRRRSSRTSTP